MAILAQSAPEAKPTTEISRVAKIPPAYLVKILQQLNRARLVQSRRGIKGGVSLARAADKVTILEIVNAIDPIQRIRTCPLGLPAHGRNLCALHSRLDSAMASVESVFGTTTLADVIEVPKSPVCPFPRAGRK